MKKLSVIIPFHAYGSYLEDCLKSLTKSTWKDFEVILVLSHVKEDISDITTTYGTLLDMTILELEEHQDGVAAARNMGLRAAQSPYVYFLDSDDYVLRDTFAEYMDAMGNADVDIAYGVIDHTWFKRSNYLSQIEDKEADLAEKETARLANWENYSKERGAKEHDPEKEKALYFLMWNRKGISTTTALNIIYRRDFLLQHDIWYPEHLKFNSDLLFLVKALHEAKHFVRAPRAVYVKRKHNDPINRPSISQESDDNKFYEKLQAYKEAIALVPEESHIRTILDRKIIRYYTRSFVKHVRRSEDPIWRNEYYKAMREVICGCRDEVVQDLKRYSRKLVDAIRKDDMDKLQSIVRNHFALRKAKRVFKNKNVLYKTMYLRKYLKEPVQENLVMFETFFGKNYADSPKYIYEYLGKHYPGQFEFVWALNDGKKSSDLPYGGTVVKRFSLKYAYYLAKAKYLVYNVHQPMWFRKREEQVFLETWHGTPLKRLVFDQEEVMSANPKYKPNFYRQRAEWDYLVSANHFSTETFKSCFMFENEMLEEGYPRNDILSAPDRDERAIELKKKLGIPQDKKTILYAPTWRDDEHYGSGQYKFDLKLNLRYLKEHLGDDYVVLLRTHYYIADHLDTTGLEGFTYNVSKYDDVSEIYLISDICITDYSSVFFDYANLRRPILFYTYDLDKYKNMLRGFYIDIEKEVPGPLLFTTEEVCDAIQHIEEINEKYAQRYDEFYERFCSLDDGNASKRIVERVFFQPKPDKKD